ncbi:hypothetical protein [Pseudoduganella sp. HUAS MS19]
MAKIALKYHVQKSHGIEPFFSFVSMTYTPFDTITRVTPVYGIDPEPTERSGDTIASTIRKTCLRLPDLASFRHQKKKKPLKNQGLSLGLMPSAARCS